MEFLISIFIKVIETIISTITKEQTKKCLDKPSKPQKKPPHT